MKKTIFIALFAIAIVSCKKEIPLSPTKTTGNSYDTQVADLVKKADGGLYNQLYNPAPNQKFPIITIKSLPGIFYIPTSGIDNATCWPAYNVCMIIVSAAKSVEGTTPPEISVVQESINETYSEDVTTRLIINKFPFETKEIKSFSAQKDERGVFHVNYK